MTDYLTFPEPPSANRYWRNWNGRQVISAEARQYKKEIEARAMAERFKPLEGPVKVSIRWYRARRSGDLDNRLKVILDALQGHLYADDSQIVEIHAIRYDDKANPRMEIRVETSTQ